MFAFGFVFFVLGAMIINKWGSVGYGAKNWADFIALIVSGVGVGLMAASTLIAMWWYLP